MSEDEADSGDDEWAGWSGLGLGLGCCSGLGRSNRPRAAAAAESPVVATGRLEMRGLPESCGEVLSLFPWARPFHKESLTAV